MATKIQSAPMLHIAIFLQNATTTLKILDLSVVAPLSLEICIKRGLAYRIQNLLQMEIGYFCSNNRGSPLQNTKFASEEIRLVMLKANVLQTKNHEN